MVYGIMGALDIEVRALCEKLTDVTAQTCAGVTYHLGALHGQRLVVCCAGMGKANAASTTQVLITRYGAERILFSGIAGNMSSAIGIGDVVVGKTVFYHDAELRMLAESAPYLEAYEGDPAMLAAALDACRALGVTAIAGRIATGDRFIGDAATKAAIAERCHPDCVEMEGAAVAQVAARNGVPSLVLRAMSDNADDSPHKLTEFSVQRYADTATAIVERMIAALG